MPQHPLSGHFSDCKPRGTFPPMLVYEYPLCFPEYSPSVLCQFTYQGFKFSVSAYRSSFHNGDMNPVFYLLRMFSPDDTFPSMLVLALPNGYLFPQRANCPSFVISSSLTYRVIIPCACFLSTYANIGTIQTLAWTLCQDDTCVRCSLFFMA